MGGHPVLAAGLLAAALVAGGCSSGAQGAPEPDGDVLPSVTSSAPSASPSPTGSATLDAAALARIPKAARAHTPQGAEAFARFYLEQVNKAWMAPDPELIRPYALESCKTCANYVATAEWLLGHTMHYDNSPSTVGVSIVLPESTASRVFVQVVNNQEQSHIVEADGGVHRTMPHIYAASDVEVRWVLNRWAVRGVKVVL